VIPISPASSEREARLADSLQTAEAEAAAALLTEAATPEQLIAVAENAAGFAEATTKKHLHPQSPPVACKRGCAWCCYQLVPVSVPETLRIASFVRELPAQDYANTVERLRSLDKATRGLTSQQRVGIPKSCAYLLEGECSIYPVRPLACAEFTSYDVQVCKRGKRSGFKPNSVLHEKARMLAYNAVQRGLSQGVKSALPHVDCEPLELTAASVIALDTPSAATSWLVGSIIFSSARLRRSAK
jgi:Fe-S-cluster containining protein